MRTVDRDEPETHDEKYVLIIHKTYNLRVSSKVKKKGLRLFSFKSPAAFFFPVVYGYRPIR